VCDLQNGLFGSAAAGVQLLMYSITKDSSYASDFNSHMQSWLTSKTTPKGLALYFNLAPNRYAASTAFLALLAGSLGIDNSAYKAWAVKQVFVLGVGHLSHPLLDRDSR